jgi:hypothetical protein
MSSRIRTRGAFLALLALSGLGACVDPKNRFTEFDERVVDAGQVNRDGGGGLFEIDGEFLLSIAVAFAPDSPLRFVATSDITIAGGSGTLTLSFQPLAFDDCDTGNGGNEVGDALESSDLAVDAAGVFQLTHDGASVDGKANPISCGEIVADLVLDGVIQSENLFCGDVSGQAHQPLDISLDGSTFAAIRIEPGTRGDANLPEPVTACP